VRTLVTVDAGLRAGTILNLYVAAEKRSFRGALPLGSDMHPPGAKRDEESCFVAQVGRRPARKRKH